MTRTEHIIALVFYIAGIFYGIKWGEYRAARAIDKMLDDIDRERAEAFSTAIKNAAGAMVK